MSKELGFNFNHRQVFFFTKIPCSCTACTGSWGLYFSGLLNSVGWWLVIVIWWQPISSFSRVKKSKKNLLLKIRRIGLTRSDSCDSLVKHEVSSIWGWSLTPHAFIVWCLVKQWDNFSLPLTTGDNTVARYSSALHHEASSPICCLNCTALIQ